MHSVCMYAHAHTYSGHGVSTEMEKVCLYLPMALGRTGPMMYAYSLCMYGCTLHEGTYWTVGQF